MVILQVYLVAIRVNKTTFVEWKTYLFQVHTNFLYLFVDMDFFYIQLAFGSVGPGLSARSIKLINYLMFRLTECRAASNAQICATGNNHT
jgi:hypothetical protein